MQPLSVHRNTLAAAPALLVPAIALALFLIAPGSLESKLALALRGVCAQRPDHAIGFSAGPVVLEARMLGIFLGFAVTVAAMWLAGRWRRSELPRGLLGLTLLLFIGLMAADGINAALYDLRGPHLYPPRNDLRLTTGLLAGIGMAGFVAPVVSFVWWKHPDRLPFFATWSELGWAMLWTAALGLLVATAPLPSSLLGILAVGAVVGSFWMVSTYVAALLWEGPGRAERWSDLGGLATAGFALTIAELLAMSALRSWMEASLGVMWLA